jgi:excisionase family DNA binding protein
MADWITTSEAAEMSGYTPRRIRQLIEERQIEAQRFGDVWQVDKASLLAYMRKAEKLGEKRGPKSES